ncbi:MAG: starch-binding protein [Bacteroidetes bacterium]|nr:starch-binding protein [Bacteroidota bacterium]
MKFINLIKILKSYNALLFCFLIINITNSYGNDNLKTDTLKVILNDTIVFKLNNCMGNIQWQESYNGIDFTNIEDETEETIIINATNNLLQLRAKVSMGENAVDCEWYSDTIIISVNNELPYLKNIITVPPIEVEFNTHDSIIKSVLQQNTIIIDSDDKNHQVNLSWELPNYKKDSVGVYIALGSFNLPSGVAPPIDNGLIMLKTETQVSVINPMLPKIATIPPKGITINSVIVGGIIISTGGYPIKEAGVYWGTQFNSEIFGEKLIVNSEDNNFTDSIKSLLSNTTYYTKAYAINKIDTAFGLQYSFKTKYDHGQDSTFPIYYNNSNKWDSTYVWIWNNTETLSDSFPGELMYPSKDIQGWYNYNVPVRFDHLIFSNGHEGTQTSTLIRNYSGWYDDSVWNDTTPDESVSILSLADIDGNKYKTVIIGNQIWMNENLKTTKYKNSENITFCNGDVLSWSNNTEGAYMWPSNDINMKDYYGALYNWYSVSNENGLCPEGWEIPKEEDWAELFNYISNGKQHGANQLMGCRIPNSPLDGNFDTWDHPHWASFQLGSSSIYGIDTYGFEAYPAGRASGTGYLMNPGGYQAEFWSSKIINDGKAKSYIINSGNEEITDWEYGKSYGLSVRCIKSSNNQKFIPNITTNTISSSSAYSVEISAKVNFDGEATVTERGFYFGTEADPQLNGVQYKEMTGIGEFSLNIAKLKPSTNYYYRAYATNKYGTATGFQKNIRTMPVLDSVLIADTLEFVYGTEQDTILRILGDSIKIIDTDSIFHTLKISWDLIEFNNLVAGNYNIFGIFTLPDFVYKDYTKSQEVTIKKIIRINSPSYLDSIVPIDNIEIMLNTSYDRALGLLPDTTQIIDSDSSIFSVKLNWTIPDFDSTLIDTFTAIGEFKLPLNVIQHDTDIPLLVTTEIVVMDSIVDYNGNKYYFVKMGNQYWLNENLKSKNSPNGNDLKETAYDENNSWVEQYGYLYSWQDAQNACPTGWHLPSEEEWQTLFDTVGGDNIAGKILKSIREEPDAHPRWKNYSSSNAIDSLGFNAFSGGYNKYSFYHYTGSSLGEIGYWWTSATNISVSMYYNRDDIDFLNMSEKKLSIRCIKN